MKKVELAIGFGAEELIDAAHCAAITNKWKCERLCVTVFTQSKKMPSISQQEKIKSEINRRLAGLCFVSAIECHGVATANKPDTELELLRLYLDYDIGWDLFGLEK